MTDRLHYSPMLQASVKCKAQSAETCRVTPVDGKRFHTSDPKEMQEYIEKVSSIGQSVIPKPIQKNSTSSVQKQEIIDHTDPKQVSRLIQEKRKNSKNGVYPEEHYTLNSGRINPTQTSIGSGAEYFNKDNGSLTILARSDGSGARAIASYGESYSDPKNELGATAIQYKQGMRSDTKTYDLYVAGYVASDGTKYGYVPDKQVSFFVYK